MDSALIVDVPAQDPAYARVLAGVTRADAAGLRVFVDDVIVDRHHIGCQ